MRLWSLSIRLVPERRLPRTVGLTISFILTPSVLARISRLAGYTLLPFSADAIVALLNPASCPIFSLSRRRRL